MSSPCSLHNPSRLHPWSYQCLPVAWPCLLRPLQLCRNTRGVLLANKALITLSDWVFLTPHFRHSRFTPSHSAIHPVHPHTPARRSPDPWLCLLDLWSSLHCIRPHDLGLFLRRHPDGKSSHYIPRGCSVSGPFPGLRGYQRLPHC